MSFSVKLAHRYSKMFPKKELDVVAALIKKDSKILLCQRKEGDSFPLLWEFPGGKIEENETNVLALKREIKEELNLDIEVGKLIQIFEDKTDYLKIKVQLFEVLDFKGRIQPLECKAFGFFNLEQIKDLKLAPVDKKIFNYLKTFF